MTRVVWSAYLFSTDETIAEREASLGFDVARLSGSLAAEMVAESYFESEQWSQWFEDESGTVIISIHEPAQISGKYRVELEREVKASASPYVSKEKI